MRKNVVDDKITPAPKTFDDNSKAFVSGSIIMSWDGPWRMAEYLTAIKDFNWDMTLTPKGPAGRQGQLVQEGYPMAKDSKNQDLAWEFVKLQSSKEDGVARPALGFISAARQDSILDPSLMKDPHYALYAQDMVDHTSRTPTLPANHRIAELFTNMTDFTSPIWTGESSVEDGLNQLDVAVQDILSKPPL
jgi:ABC-type glycerol-3-phosphate transport system substrate-binding protein